MSAFQDLLRKLENSTMEELGASSTEQLPELLNRVCEIFEQYPISDQLTAVAFVFGMSASAIEGELTPFERDHHEPMGFEERLQIFTTIARVVFKHAMDARETLKAQVPVTIHSEPKGVM